MTEYFFLTPTSKNTKHISVSILILFILTSSFSSCETSSRKERDTRPDTVVSFGIKEKEVVRNTIVNFYIENSGSMDGYVRGVKDFKTVVANLLVKSKDFSRNDRDQRFNIHLINNQIFPLPQIDDLTSFAQSLDPTPGSTFKQTGNTSVSEINRMIDLVLSQTSKDTLSVFISDCIYSIDAKKNTQGSLAFQQAGTLDAFLKKLRNSKENNFTTAVYKFMSGFEGSYYSYDNSSTYINSQRPYYIWLLGERGIIESFLEVVKVENQVGFQNSYFLSDFEQEQPYFTVLQETNKIGKFRKTDKKSKVIKSIKLDGLDNGVLQFAIAVDLKNIEEFVDESYLTNPNNYSVPDGFKVQSIDQVNINKMHKNDFKRVTPPETETATHFVTVSYDPKYALQDLKLELTNKLPAWIQETNTMDDRDITLHLNKTFGFEYLIKGVADAYQTQKSNQKSYFTIKVEIKN